MPSVQNEKDAAVVIGEKFAELIKALVDMDASKVEFGVGYEIELEQLPLVSIELGPDTPTDPDGKQMNGYTDSLLVVYVDIYDQQNTRAGLKRTFRKRALCHKAIMDDYTLGGLVVQVRYGGNAEPVYDPETGLPGWTLRVPFTVHYRFNDADRTILI